MQKLIMGLLFVAALAILAYPAGRAFDAAYGADVVLLGSVYDETSVEVNWLTFDDTGLDADAVRRAVIEVYGTTGSAELETERVLVFDESRLILPAPPDGFPALELEPELKMLPAGSATADGYYPAQVQSLDYVTLRITLAGAVAIAVLLLLRSLTRPSEDGAPE